ncbi:MAG: DNA helicase RecQ [Lachnospiraceae bacterium]|nr:DNA helicase RecQ [Lachnospiraceae bacterium]
MNVDKQSKNEILRQYYGYDTFREGQEELIDAVLDGQDVFGIMPTGAGKSVCYQVPALMMDGITIVISPQISLMKDQVRALNEMGVHAAYLNSSLTYGQYKLALANAAKGQYKIIYVAPERLETAEFLAFALNAPISMVSIDEAHCVSQWGQDFRPGYLKIKTFINKLKIRPVVSAFTATATKEVREDVTELLGLRKPKLVVTGFNRPNLYFGVSIPKDKKATLKQYVSVHSDESGIIYCATRKGVEEIHELLLKEGYPVTRYHAGLDDEERRRNQDDFIFDRKPIMVATNAFGMGIDKSNVRYVFHYNMPKNLESYYQEAGRAGRDGEAAECILLFGKKDVVTNEYFIEQDRENDELTETELEIVKAAEREKLRRMTWYCYTQGCLREFMLHYFGEEMAGGCNNCSGCLNDTEVTDVTEEAILFVKGVEQAGGHFGEKVIVEMLHGSLTPKVKQFKLDQKQAFGTLKAVSLDKLSQISRQLQMNGYIEVTSSEYPVLQTGKQAEKLLFGEEKLMLREIKKESKKKVSKARSKRASQMAKSNSIFERLRKVRLDLAREEKVPPYLIFSDRTLVEMCQKMPASEAEMLEISGVGAHKLQKYGDAFLSVIRSFGEE